MAIALTDMPLPWTAAPQIEGFIEPGVNWRITMQSWVGLPAFTVSEVA